MKINMIYILLAAAIFAADFFIKKYIDENRKIGEESRILGGRVILRKCYNKGAMLNAFEQWPRLVKAISGGALILMCLLFFFLLREKGKKGLKLGLAMILGGGAGNLCDRLTKGRVVDYFSFQSRFPKLTSIVFNLSDMFIFLGAALMLIFHKK